MMRRNALLFALAVGAILVLLEVTSQARLFDGAGTWVVDAAATRTARGDDRTPDVTGTLTLDVRGYFVLEIVDAGEHLVPRSGIWSAERRGFSIEEGTWRGPRGQPHTARVRADGALVLDLAGKPIVLRRPAR